MARGRMLQNRISKSKKLASLSSDTVRLLYTWMLAHLDVNGNFYADPAMVNNLVFTRLNKPVRVIAEAIEELAEKELVVLYQDNGDTYLNYPDFLEKQPKIYPDREGKPEIPEMTHDKLMSNSRVTHLEENIKEKKIRERNVFIPPSLDDVVNFFSVKGYSQDVARRAFEYYSTAGWKDSRGNAVKNWKQKMIAVWFKDENRIKAKNEEPTKSRCQKCGNPNWKSLTSGLCDKCYDPNANE